MNHHTKAIKAKKGTMTKSSPMRTRRPKGFCFVPIYACAELIIYLSDAAVLGLPTNQE